MTTLIALVALMTLLALGGCSGASSGGGKPVSPSQAAPKASGPSAVSAPAPTIELVAPAAGAPVAAGDVAVSVKTTGLTFTMPSNTNVAGEGHVHFTLDGAPFKMSVKPDYTYAGVAPGDHKLVAELVQNDTKSFSPPVKAEIEFTAK